MSASEVVHQLLDEAWAMGRRDLRLWQVTRYKVGERRYAVRVGNTVIVAVGEDRNDWIVEEYPPPKKPISSRSYTEHMAAR